MLDRVITDPRQVEPTWLSRVLTDSGDLQSGMVSAIEIAADTSTHAASARLALRYSEDATGHRPRSVFLKLVKEASAVYFGRTEVDYYLKLTAPIDESPAPRCYHAGYDQQSGRYHLLLEDLSQTHRPGWEVEPTETSATRAARALARLHAYWWDHPELTADERYPRPPIIHIYRAEIDDAIPRMFDYLGDRISHQTRELLALVYERHGDRMVERAAQGRQLTYIHGDPNPGNILFPNNPDGQAYLVDRQLFDFSLSIWLGVSDVAYMMVHWWQPEVRRQFEGSVLRAYHEELECRGVAGYSREQLWQDYRLAAMQSIYVATDWCSTDEERSGMEWVWWPQLQKSIEAFHDLRCAELLQ
jgi:hypothetical protein